MSIFIRNWSAGLPCCFLNLTHSIFLVNVNFCIYRRLRTIHKGCLYDLILCSLENSNTQICCQKCKAAFLTPLSSSRRMIMVSKDWHYISCDQTFKSKDWTMRERALFLNKHLWMGPEIYNRTTGGKRKKKCLVFIVRNQDKKINRISDLIGLIWLDWCTI